MNQSEDINVIVVLKNDSSFYRIIGKGKKLMKAKATVLLVIIGLSLLCL